MGSPGDAPPPAARAALDTALAAYLAGDAAAARAGALAALEVDPTVDAARYLLALVLEDVGDLAAARDALDRLLAAPAPDAARAALHERARRLRELVALRIRRAES